MNKALGDQLKGWPEEAKLLMQAYLINVLDGYNMKSVVELTDTPEVKRQRQIEEGETRVRRKFLSNFFNHNNMYVAHVEDVVDLHEYCVIYNARYYYLTCGYDDVADTLYVLKGSAFCT